MNQFSYVANNAIFCFGVTSSMHKLSIEGGARALITANHGLVPEMVSRWRHATIRNNVCI